MENSKKRGRRLGNDIDTFASGSGSNTASVVDNAYSHPHSSTSQNYQTMYHHQQQQPQHVYNTSHHTPSHTNIPQYYPRPSSSTAAAVAKDPTYHYRSSELSGQTLTSSASVQFVNNNSSMVSPPPPRIRPYQVTASPSTDSSSSTSSSAVLTSTSVSTTTPPLAESTITMLESKIQHLEEMLKSVVKSQQQQQEKALTKVSTSHQKRQSPIGNSNAITSSSSSVPTTSASNSNSSSSRQGMMNDGITIVQDGTTNTMRFFGSTSVSSSAVVYESPRYNNGVLTLYLQLDPRTLQDFSFGHTRDSLDSPLCSSDLMLHLVNHYFAYIHPYFPMIDKAHFLRQLRDRETGGPFGVLLHAVLALVVQVNTLLELEIVKFEIYSHLRHPPTHTLSLSVFLPPITLVHVMSQGVGRKQPHGFTFRLYSSSQTPSRSIP